MAYALTTEQVQQVVRNTVLVILARPDLLPEWETNLADLLHHMRSAALDNEAIFLAAVLTLLHHHDDALPTGTPYDQAWESILVGLKTGAIEPAQQDDSITLDHLLESIVQAMIAIQTEQPEQRQAIYEEILNIKAAAAEAEVAELVVWLDDALDVLDGADAAGLAHHHDSIYAAFWNRLVEGAR